MQTGIHHRNQLITSLDEFEFQFAEYSGSFRSDETGLSVKLSKVNTRGILVIRLKA